MRCEEDKVDVTHLEDVLSSSVLRTHRSVAVGEKSSESLEKVSTALLSEHVRVSLPEHRTGISAQYKEEEKLRRERDSPSNLRKVISVERSESSSEGETVSTTSTSTFFDRVRSHDGTEGFETGRRSVNVGEEGEISVFHRSLVE